MSAYSLHYLPQTSPRGRALALKPLRKRLSWMGRAKAAHYLFVHHDPACHEALVVLVRQGLREALDHFGEALDLLDPATLRRGPPLVAQRPHIDAQLLDLICE